MADLDDEGADRPPSMWRQARRWLATLTGGTAAVTAGAGGCLLAIAIVLAPLILFVLIFGQGLVSIFER
jgi:hypothetical protein